MLLVARVVGIDESDIGALADRRAHVLEFREAQMAVDGLDDQRRPFIRTEGPRERLDQAKRILALDHAQEVEREEEDEGVGQAEVAPVEARVDGADAHRQRHAVDRPHARRGHGAGDEARGRPHLVDLGEGAVQRRGEALEFPEPVAGRVPAVEEGGADIPREARRGVGVHAHHVDVEGRAAVASGRERMLLAAQRAAVVDGRMVDAGGLERAHQQRAASPMPSSACR